MMAIALIGTTMATVPANAEVQDSYNVYFEGQIGDYKFYSADGTAPSINVTGDNSYSIEWSISEPTTAIEGSTEMYLSTDINVDDFTSDGEVASTGIDIVIDSIEVDGSEVAYTRSDDAYIKDDNSNIKLKVYDEWSDPYVTDIDMNFEATNNIKVNFTITGLDNAIAIANTPQEQEPDVTTVPTIGTSEEVEETTTTTTVANRVQTPDWANAYSDFLLGKDFGDLDADTTKFALAYIDNDSMPELLLCDEGGEYQIYTYDDDDGVIIYMGKAGADGLILYKEKGSLVFTGTNTDSLRSVNVIAMKDDTLVDKIYYQYDKTNDKYYVDGEEVTAEEYQEKTNEYEETVVVTVDYYDDMYEITDSNVKSQIINKSITVGGVTPTIGESSSSTSKSSSSTTSTPDTGDSGVAAVLVALGLATVSATILKKKED